MNGAHLKISDILDDLLKQRHISEAELARQINVPRATINRLVSGRTPDPRASTLSAIAEYFSITIDQLLGKNEAAKLSDASNEHNIPILKWEEAACWEQFIPSEVTLKNTESIMRDSSIQDGRFALRVKGDAMTPQFQDGTILIIDPHKEAANRDYVIAHLIETNEIVFRQILVDGKYRCLKALNNSFPILELKKNDIVIGIIIQGRSIF